jgi:hypothetical protein
MNLQELNVDKFMEQITRLVEERKNDFLRELDRRVNELKDGVKDMADWKANGLPSFVDQLLSKDTLVFTRTIAKPSHVTSYPNQRPVYIDFDGQMVNLGQAFDTSIFYGARVVLMVIPGKKEPTP